MKRYLIEDAKCGLTEGGMACGPVSGNVVVSVKYHDGDRSGWLSVVEVDSIPNVFQTDEDIFERLLAEDPHDEAFIRYLQNHSISCFDGIEFGDGYDETFESIANGADDPAVPLIRYLVALIRCELDEVNGLIEMAKNRYADELDIPMSDVEEEWLEDLEDNE